MMNPKNGITPLAGPSRNPFKVKMTKTGLRIFYVLASVVIVLLCVLWLGNAMAQQASNVTNWKSATATIKERQGRCDAWLLTNAFTSHDTARWVVSYTYQGKAVEGKLCTTGVYTYDYYDRDSESIVKIVPGAQVSVLVNPDNTSELVLQDGMAANDFNSQLTAIAWSFVAVGLIMAIYIVLTQIPSLRSKTVL